MINEIVESIPNFSEGKRRDVIEKIINSIKELDDLMILDSASDERQNRTVLTLVGTRESVYKGLMTLYEKCVSMIDMRQHSGEHERIGSVDVVPIIPIKNVSMKECIELSKKLGNDVAERYKLPVFLYEESAVSHARRSLARIRRGEFENLSKKLSEPKWKPDFGPTQSHTTAGATIIGAREFLIAMNIYINSDNAKIAEKLAGVVGSKIRATR